MYASPAGLSHSPYHLRERHFAMTLGIALLLHVAAYGAYMLSPREQIINIPVRTLNIRLGSEEIMPALPPKPEVVEKQVATPPEQPPAVQKQEVPKEVAKPVRGHLNRLEKSIARKAADYAISAAQVSAEIARKAQKAKDAETKRKASSEAAIAAQQFVRKREASAALEAKSNKTQGSMLGNTRKSDAEMLARYEQTISLWIAKYQVYPAEAYAKKLEGDAVVRVRIDRRGNVRHNTIEKSTGYRDLDRAALDMIRRANPMPPVSAGYPAGELIEFLIPVSFRLQ